MKKEVLDKLIRSNYGDEMAMAYIELTQFATLVVEHQNPELVKIRVHPVLVQDWNDANKLLDIKHKELVDKFIDELPELNKAEVSKLKKKYIVKLRLEDLEKDF